MPSTCSVLINAEEQHKKMILCKRQTEARNRMSTLEIYDVPQNICVVITTVFISGIIGGDTVVWDANCSHHFEDEWYFCGDD